MADNGAIGTADCDLTIGDGCILPKTVVAEFPLAAVARVILCRVRKPGE